jgi:two-component system cell cycle sensor histidine kinase PleC
MRAGAPAQHRHRAGVNQAAQTDTMWQEAPSLLASLDALRVAVTIFDAQGRLRYANAHLNHLLHALPPAASLIGKSYEEIVRLEIAGGEIAPAALAGGIPAFVARRLSQLEPGAWAPCDVALADRRVMELKARRTPAGMTVLLWTDVTAARAHLSRLEDAVSLSAEALAFFDADDRLILCNALYAEICGAQREALLGKTFSDIARLVTFSGRLVLEEDPETWLARRLKGHRQSAGAVTIRTNSGECYLVRDRATPDGGRTAVFTDITDTVRAESALVEQRGALDEASQQAEQQRSYLADLTLRLDQASASVDSAKTTLLRTMSHELKTPLNAILGFSDLMATLSERLTPAQVREYAGLVHQGGCNLLKMINQIMDLTKISAGRYELRRSAIDAGGMLWLARDAFLDRAEARGLVLTADGAPVGLMVDADEGVLTTMIHSLVDNAVTFTRSGGTVSLGAAAQGSDIAITVRDNGPGVAIADLARIRQPFEHAGSAEGSQHAKGAGLGLTLVAAFAELHGGRLELSSEPGAGFTAILLLPAAVRA